MKFSDQVSQMWLNGQKNEVMSIATNRLAQNTSDIAGLLLKMAYEIEFLLDDDLTNTMNRVSQVGGAITETNFAALFPRIQDDADSMLELIPLTPLTPAELDTERAKGSIVGKPFNYHDVLVALEEAGLIP